MRFNVRKLNIAIILLLTISLFGIASYTVFASVKQQAITFSNKISFKAEGVYFHANVVVYESENPNRAVVNTNYYKTGDPTIDTNEKDFALATAPLEFGPNSESLIYHITIYNYSEFPIDVSGSVSNQRENENFITNEFDKSSFQLAKYSIGEVIPQNKFILTSTCLKFTESFQFNNQIVITLSELNS